MSWMYYRERETKRRQWLEVWTETVMGQDKGKDMIPSNQTLLSVILRIRIFTLHTFRNCFMILCLYYIQRHTEIWHWRQYLHPALHLFFRLKAKNTTGAKAGHRTVTPTLQFLSKWMSRNTHAAGFFLYTLLFYSIQCSCMQLSCFQI